MAYETKTFGAVDSDCNFRATPHTVPPTDVETVKYPHNWCWWTPPVLLKHKPFNWVVNLIWNHENDPLGNVTAEGWPAEYGRGKNLIPKPCEIMFYYLTSMTLKQKCFEIQHSQSQHFTFCMQFFSGSGPLRFHCGQRWKATENNAVNPCDQLEPVAKSA